MTDNAATDDVWTVQRILQWTTDFLRGKELESPRLEAELLLAHARQCQRINLYTDLNEEVTPAERAKMREFVKRRSSREPLAYITGVREFYGREFKVGRGILVPRPETETLIDVCLDMIPTDQLQAIGEVGFGSGCIAVTLAAQRSQLSIVACDVSEVAMQFATANADRHKVRERVSLVGGSGLAAVRGHIGTDKLHGIVSNPPYIRTDELPGLAPEVRDHEPREALVSGDDGLDLMRQLVSEAPALLHPEGWLAVELDPAQAAEVAGLMTASGFRDAQIHNDLSGAQRVVVGRLAS